MTIFAHLPGRHEIQWTHSAEVWIAVILISAAILYFVGCFLYLSLSGARKFLHAGPRLGPCPACGLTFTADDAVTLWDWPGATEPKQTIWRNCWNEKLWPGGKVAR